ncbi:MAG TPA: hypothetical protein VLE48_08170 [Terriglobales bacterium]|nr:hypothetical protein [Terriglobales bacterium]
MEQRLRTENQFKSGANWFFWIGGLSLINTIVGLTGAQWGFIIGLGITQLVDAIAQGTGAVGTVAAVVVDLFVVGVFVLFGVCARKMQTWAFVVGMVLYALDGLLFLLAMDFLGIGFHAFALYQIYRGLAARNELSEAPAAARLQTAPSSTV